MYIKVTKQVTGIDIEPLTKRKKKVENPVSVIIISKGIFKSKVVGIFPRKFMNAVIEHMNDGKGITGEDGDSYYKEYLNMCFGRIISSINNEIGKASRFVIPILMDGAYDAEQEDEYKNRVNLIFSSEYGNIKIGIGYDVLPEHSSN